MNSILIIAHSPFAHAMRQCALHVFPDCEQAIVALDVLPNVSPEETLAAARITLAQQLHAPRSQVLVLADVFGATPCNVAQKLVDGVRPRGPAAPGCRAVRGGSGSPEPGEKKAQ